VKKIEKYLIKKIVYNVFALSFLKSCEKDLNTHEYEKFFACYSKLTVK